MTQHVLITGGSGYLGSIMTGTLLDAGFKVTIVDSLIYNQRTLFQYANNPNFDFIKGDARDKDLMKGLIAKADIMIPLACIVGAPACDLDPWRAESVNFGAIEMMDGLRSKEQLVLYPNTNSGYGAQTGEQFCTEETPLEPISIYGKTKCKAEDLLLQTGNAVVFRLATVFGSSPRMRMDLLVNHFTYAAFSEKYIVLFEKDFKRNYIHIRDVADCFLHSIKNVGAMRDNIYNLGLNSANLSKEELALKIKEHLTDFYIHYSEIGTDPDKRNYIVSNDKLIAAGFEAGRGLDPGIQELIKAYRMLGRGDLANI